MITKLRLKRLRVSLWKLWNMARRSSLITPRKLDRIQLGSHPVQEPYYAPFGRQPLCEIDYEDLIFLIEYLLNLILQQGDIRLFWDPEQIFIIIRNVAFKTIETNNNTIVIFKSINLLLTVFAISNKVKEPCVSIPFQESFDISPFIPFKLFLSQKRN
jgi:hypothetical protein